MPPITRSPDIERLIADEYEIEIVGTTLVVHSVPYVRPDGTIGYGELLKDLNLSGDKLAPPNNHQMWWAGDQPSKANGEKASAPAMSSHVRQFDGGHSSTFALSAKPHGKQNHDDYYSMVTTYVGLLSKHAREIDPGVNARTGRPFKEDDPESPFHYRDSATTRANIVTAQAKLEGQKVGIIGLGGTGSYVLDFLVKTPAEIHCFDDDRFSSHNAFRSPGAASIEELREIPRKTKYYEVLYSKLRKGLLHFHDTRIDESNLEELHGLDFVFICVDRQANRRVLWECLRAKNIPFIDTGLGLHVAEKLGGQLRVIRPDLSDDESWAASLPKEPGPDAVYNTNVQVVELNAMTASLAVISWKKHVGFYADFLKKRRSVYVVDGDMIAHED